MRNKVIVNINIYCLLLHYSNSQYNLQVYGGVQQGYQYPYQNIGYPQYSNQRIHKHYENNKWMQDNYEDYNEYKDYADDCACDKCDETITKPSCRDVCPNCFTPPSPLIAPSYVFLPFPYPYQITPNTTLSPVTKTVETATASTVMNTVSSTTVKDTKETRSETVKIQTSEAVTISNDFSEEKNDMLRQKSLSNIKDRDHFTLTALRRTKPNWLPKYGIVPISDTFAEKLMIQMRSMRVLHPQKGNI